MVQGTGSGLKFRVCGVPDFKVEGLGGLGLWVQQV